MKKTFWASCRKIIPLVLNYPVTFVLGSARCSSALCLFYIKLFSNSVSINITQSLNFYFCLIFILEIKVYLV